MITVYKYVLEVGNGELRLPVGAEILSVAFQGDDLCLWAKVNDKCGEEAREFDVFGTGWNIPEHIGTEREFIGTAHTDGGLVFHVFERLN